MCEFCKGFEDVRKVNMEFPDDESKLSVALVNIVKKDGTTAYASFMIDDLELNYCPACGKELK